MARRAVLSRSLTFSREVPVLWYVRALGLALVLQGGLGAVLKLFQGRGDDLAHNALHLIWGLAGLVAASGGWARAGARWFAVTFGLFYLGLGTLGWFWPNPLGILPLAAGDHVFHLIVGAVTLAVGLISTKAR